MFMPLMNMLYLLSIIQTILISMSSSNWLIVWMMMEINLMMFIPFICSKKYLIDVSPSIKYFLAQVMGSLFLILFIVLNLMKNYIESMQSISSALMMISLAIKSGTPPFHFWFPQLMEMVNWIQMIALLTIQKIIPLVFMYYSINFILWMFVVISGLTGALGGLSQNSMKKIIAYSSMTHMGWLIMSMTFNPKIMIWYFCVYSLMTGVFLFLIKDMKFYLSSSNVSMQLNPAVSVCICACLLSISGIPPFSGFFIKLLIIYGMTTNMFIILLMVIFSLISVIYYMRMVYFFMPINSINMKLKNKVFFNKTSYIYYVISLNILAPAFMLIEW